MYSIFPTHTLSKNIGFDGSGVNSKASNYFTSKESNISKLNLGRNIISNKIISTQKSIISSHI